METLARAQDMPCNMHFRWQGPQSSEFPAFHLQHAFGWELDTAATNELTRPDLLHKSHILPSTNNLAHLQSHKKVVLLRDVDGIIGAYKRGEETGVYKQKTQKFKDCVTLQDWVSRAKEVGLYQDLLAFCERWRAAAGDQLIVTYENMVSNPAKELARIETYFGWPPSGTANLLRRKYTRSGDASLKEHLATVDAWKAVGKPENPNSPKTNSISYRKSLISSAFSLFGTKSELFPFQKMNILLMFSY